MAGRKLGEGRSDYLGRKRKITGGKTNLIELTGGGGFGRTADPEEELSWEDIRNICGRPQKKSEKKGTQELRFCQRKEPDENKHNPVKVESNISQTKPPLLKLKREICKSVLGKGGVLVKRAGAS